MKICVKSATGKTERNEFALASRFEKTGIRSRLREAQLFPREGSAFPRGTGAMQFEIRANVAPVYFFADLFLSRHGTRSRSKENREISGK